MLRPRRALPSSLVFALALSGLFALLPGSAQGQEQEGVPSLRFGAGGHLGVGLDDGAPMLGADFMVDVLHLSSRVTMAVWPSYSHVFIEDGLDANILDVNLPFQIHMRRPIARPFAAPGLGLVFADGSSIKLNLTGGCFFHVTDHIEPFTAVTVRLIDQTYVDLLVGLLARF
jgi:hypothetical protein